MQPSTTLQQRIFIWDVPTRLGHWVLALAVTAAIITGWQGGEWLIWHTRLGLFICGWLTFRVIWGMIGSTYARFHQFLPTRASISAYLNGTWHGVGHNPLGALSVLALLTLLGLQVMTGLVSTDDIAFTGPLYSLVHSAASDLLSRWHRQLIWVSGAMIVLHLGAIWFYTRIRRQPLVRAMLDGWCATPDTTAPAMRPGSRVALIVALLCAFGSSWLASGQWLARSQPPPNAVTVPAW